MKDVKTGGQVTDQFCHELHDYATNINFPSEMASQNIKRYSAPGSCVSDGPYQYRIIVVDAGVIDDSKNINFM